MNVDQEHYSDLVAPQSELTASAGPRPVIPAEIEQVIERMSARYIADLRALSEELSQHVHATESEAETLEAPRSELEHRQDTLPTQIENANSGFPGPEIPIRQAAPDSQSAHTQQRPIAQFREYLAQPQAQHQRLNRLGMLRQKGRAILSWVVILFVIWVISVLVGIGITLFLMK